MRKYRSNATVQFLVTVVDGKLCKLNNIIYLLHSRGTLFTCDSTLTVRRPSAIHLLIRFSRVPLFNAKAIAKCFFFSFITTNGLRRAMP